jgi:site-specific recombinase XerD
MEDLTFNVIGKGNKERKCFFNERTREAITKYLYHRTDNNPLLIISIAPVRNKRFSNPEIKGMMGARFRSITEKTGINRLHPHKLRRTFATNMLNKGMGIEMVSILLGHENLSTTQLYIVQDNEIIHSKYKELMGDNKKDKPILEPNKRGL